MKMKSVAPMVVGCVGLMMGAGDAPTSHEDPIIINGNSVHINMRTRTMEMAKTVVGETKFYQHMHGKDNGGSGWRQGYCDEFPGRCLEDK